MTAHKMRAENEAAFDSMFEAMRLANLIITPAAAECEAYAKKHFGPNGIKLEDVFGPPRNDPLIIGTPHHNDPLDPENQQ
jgi:hypothetical protein